MISVKCSMEFQDLCSLVLLFGMSTAYAQDAAEQVYGPTLSDGSRIEVAEKGISIIPPVGWKIYDNMPNTTLMLQIPYKEGQAYQSTIQVMAFQGGTYIDEYTAREFEERIVNKFQTAVPGIEGFRIRNHMLVETQDGRPGILYYSEFRLDDLFLMQAHLLLSSENLHYLISYTDDARQFEESNNTSVLRDAWSTMTSVELSGPTPQRFRVPLILVSGTVIVFVLAGFMWRLRFSRAKRDYDDFAEDSENERRLSKTNFLDAEDEEGDVETSKSPDDEDPPLDQAQWKSGGDDTVHIEDTGIPVLAEKGTEDDEEENSRLDEDISSF